MAGKCTVDGEDNEEDKTWEEADMTPSPVSPKSNVSYSGPNPYFKCFWLLPIFWTAVDTFRTVVFVGLPKM